MATTKAVRIPQYFKLSPEIVKILERQAKKRRLTKTAVVEMALRRLSTPEVA